MSARSGRSARKAESGMTLLELLVSVAVLAIIGGVIATAFSIGLKSLGSGGASDRLIGAKDLSSLEQSLGKDLARASCIAPSPAQSATALGLCTTFLTTAPAACGSSASSLVCIAWPEWGTTPPSCHVAVYSWASAQPAPMIRIEFAGAVRTQTTHVVTDPIAVPGGVGLPAPFVTPSGGKWVSNVVITVASQGVAHNKPGGTFILHPVAGDPTAKSVTSTGGELC